LAHQQGVVQETIRLFVVKEIATRHEYASARPLCKARG